MKYITPKGLKNIRDAVEAKDLGRTVELPVIPMLALLNDFDEMLALSRTTVLERYEDLLFAQRRDGKLTPAQDDELSQLEDGLCARLPARTEYEQDIAFFAKLLRERMEKEQCI